MFSPSVLYYNGKWYAVWNVNNDTNQFATTESVDFWVWKPQDYPYLDNKENFLHPHLSKENGLFIVRYQTSNGNYYQLKSQDFHIWSSPEPINEQTYTKSNRQKTITLSGNKISGEVHRVSYSFVEGISQKTNDAVLRNNLYNENCGEDENRFKGIKGLKGNLIISNSSKPISTNLIGIFFEDINYSADGGLYAELIQNRDFEYSNLDRGEWSPQSFWELKGDGAQWKISTENPIHANNSHYASIISSNGFVLENSGFDGIVVKKGEQYDISLFAKTMNGKSQKLAS